MRLDEVPVIYVIIYRKIREKTTGRLIRKKVLNQWIDRHLSLLVPKCFINDIIEDMCRAKLLKKINQRTYQILSSKCEKRLRKYPYW